MAIGSVDNITNLGGTNSINHIAKSMTNGLNKLVADDSEDSVSFKDYLKGALNQLNGIQLNSNQVTEDFITGKIDSIHEVTIAAEKASVSLMFAMEIRNKIMDAYQEIMRMQI